MPPHRKPRRFLPTTSFYDRAGAIGSPPPSPTGSSFPESEDAYTLTGYGELSAEATFTLPPSPTQTIKYRYRAYRPKLARLRKLRSSASKGPLKAKASAYHSSSDYASILNAYLSGAPGQSPKRDFRALLQKCRETAAEARRERGGDAYATPRKLYADNRYGGL